MRDQNYSQMAGTPTEEVEEQRISTLWIGIVTCLALIIVTFISYTSEVQSGRKDFTSLYITGTLAMVGFLVAILAQRGRARVVSYFLLTSIWLSIFLLPLLAPSQATAPALAGLIFAIAVASATLPSRSAFRAGIVSILIAVAVIVFDLYLPANLRAQTTHSAVVPVSIGLSIIYAVFIFRRFSFYALRIKLLVTFILVATVPLAILGLYNNIVTRDLLKQQGNAELRSLANLTAAQVDGFVGNQLDSIRIEAQQPGLVSYLKMSALLRSGTPEEIKAAQTLSSFVRKDPVYIESYALLDSRGYDVLDTVQENVGQIEDQSEYFASVIQSGDIYASNLIFNGGKPNIIFSAPVRDDSGQIIGVLRAEYNAAFLQAMINELLTTRGQGQALGIVDQTNLVQMAYSGDRTELYKSYRFFSQQNLSMLQAERILPPGPSDSVLSPSQQMISGLENIAQAPFFSTYSQSLKDNTIVTATPLKNVDWLIVASSSERLLFAPIREQTRGIVLISLGLILAAAISSLLASQVLMQPITALTQVAEKITSGYLTARAQISTQDEIGSLGTAFNNMTFQLRQALAGLENRVQERTAELENARLQSEQRAQSLQAISDVARAVSVEQDLEELLQLVVRLVSEKFGFYHTGIFLIDPTSQFAILRSASSEGGQHMLERGHRLEVGQTGIVGFVAQAGKPRIALDVGIDAVFFNNPDLPETRSEMALPLSSRGRTIGVLDVQSTQSGAFKADDISTLSIMADQIAIAIENARLFGQAQDALSEIQALYSQYLRQEWEAFSKQENLIGYHHSLAGGRRINRPVETDQIKRAIGGNAVVLSGDDDGGQPSIAMPVKLRGEVIGVLNVASPKRTRQWSQEEIDLVQAISERLALALENARLLQDSLRRAAKEQKISQIATKIGTSINMRNLLQTAVEELGRALPGSDVVIQFQDDGAKARGIKK